MTEQLRISAEIAEKTKQLENVKSELETIRANKEELLSRVSEESEVEEIDETDAELDQLSEQEEEKKKEEENLESEITKLEKELDEVQEEIIPEGEERNMENKELVLEQRNALNTFIRTKGQVRNETGLISSEVGVVIPEEIAYNPQLEVRAVVDLAELVEKTKVSTASGKYPILKRATAVLNTVEELAENPKLAEPEFLEVAWEVETYRGALPISQEAIDDSAVDLTELVARNAREQKINTTNAKISDVLKTFEAKTVKDGDEVKAVFNIDLNPAYNSGIVASQSFFHALDTLKDGSGRYLMQDDITSPTGRKILGRQIIAIVPDTMLGEEGEANAFIGDLRRAVLFADRKDIALQWVDHHIYGRYLAVVTRFDVGKADANAGFFVTFDATGA